MTSEQREFYAKTMQPEHAAALTCYGEARGEPVNGMIAVLNVFANRRMAKGQTIPQVCLQPYQFSCWNEHDPNSPRLVALAGYLMEGRPTGYNPALDVCLLLARKLVSNELRDITLGATHYYSTAALADPPYWAAAPSEKTVDVGSHRFFRRVKF